MTIIFYAMIGWCGTRWPGWWRGPKPPVGPSPEPWWWRSRILGIAGGIAGSLAANYAFGEAATVLTGTLGAFAGGVIFNDVARGLEKG